MKLKYIIPVLLLIFLVVRSGYNVLVEQKRTYDKYQGMEGTVLWSTFAPRSAIYLCGIKLDDGTYSEINAGARTIAVGDRFINHIKYNRLIGMSGYAYFIIPDESKNVLWGVVWMTSILMLIVVALVKIYLS